MKNLGEVRKKVIEIIESVGGRIIPKQIIERKLNGEYNNREINGAISNLVDDFIIDLLLDYPSEDFDIDVGHPIWHLKIISNSEADELRKLPAIKIALLRLLYGTDDSYYPGELPVEEVKLILKERGFEESDVEWLLFVEDKVRRYDVTRDGTSVKCYCVIPEYEKTEEYKQEQERILWEAHIKNEERQYQWDIVDLAADIIDVLRDVPEGLSREDIVPKLIDHPKRYIDDAFQVALEREDIERVDHPSGKEWYRYIYGEEDV